MYIQEIYYIKNNLFHIIYTSLIESVEQTARHGPVAHRRVSRSGS